MQLTTSSPGHDTRDPIVRLPFTALAMIAEFEGDLIRARPREAMTIAKGKLREREPKPSRKLKARLLTKPRSGPYHGASHRAHLA